MLDSIMGFWAHVMEKLWGLVVSITSCITMVPHYYVVCLIGMRFLT